MNKVILLFATIFLFAVTGFSQIEGRVVDAKGNGVPNVTITATGEDGTVAATVTTGDDGTYSFEDLDPGKYKITAKGAAGLQPATRENVNVAEDDKTTLNITLAAVVQPPVPQSTPVKPPAVTVDEIISRHIDALGGREKLLALKTVRMTGTITAQGAEVPVTNTIFHLIGSRSDFSIPGRSPGYRIVTPTKGTIFTYIDFSGTPATQNMDAEELKHAQAGLDIQGPFLDYRTKGISLELLGTEKVDGEDNFKLKLTFKSGGVTTYFISSKTYLITKTVNTFTIIGEPAGLETTYSNYKKNADGYLFAYTIATTLGATDYDKIETNIAVDPAIFK